MLPCLQEEEITAAVVTCGESHSACITRRGMLYTFGLGSAGQLGLGPADHSDHRVRTVGNRRRRTTCSLR